MAFDGFVVVVHRAPLSHANRGGAGTKPKIVHVAVGPDVTVHDDSDPSGTAHMLAGKTRRIAPLFASTMIKPPASSGAAYVIELNTALEAGPPSPMKPNIDDLSLSCARNRNGYQLKLAGDIDTENPPSNNGRDDPIGLNPSHSVVLRVGEIKTATAV